MNCSHGRPLIGARCPDCQADVEAALAWMEKAKAAGTYNDQGYTPAEWRAAVQKREAQRWNPK